MAKIRPRGQKIVSVIIVLITALFLLACGTNSDEELVKAAMKGNTETIEKLLAKGADANATDQKHRSTALMWAAHNGHTEAIKVLIRSGAAIDARREKGETALWFAAQKGQLETLKILVENGAKTDIVGRDGDTAIAIAEKNGHAHVVDYLNQASRSEQKASD